MLGVGFKGWYAFFRTAMMETVKQKIKNFFQRYEERFTRALAGEDDVMGTTEAFAESFIEASPLGIISNNNDDAFRRSISKGNEAYRDMGVTAMKITNIKISELNRYHYMVHVAWQSKALRKDKQEVIIEFEVIYLVQYLKGALKIFAYITGDEQAALKEAGLA